MEPQVPQVNPSPEMGAYRTPIEAENPLENVTAQQQAAVERGASNPEIQSAPQQSSQTTQALPQLPTLPMPQPQQTPVVAQSSTTRGATPSVASDDDVIEKEWVDKAKKIVAQTKDNPYEQEKEVNKLQADYIKKRYGKDIKLSSE